MDMLRAAWRYRFFILSSIRNDLRSRFFRSELGGLWVVIHLLAKLLLLTTTVS